MIVFPIVFFLLPPLLLSLCLTVPFSQSLTAFQLSLRSAFLFLFSSSRLFFLSLSTFFQLCSVPLPLFKQYLPPKMYSSSCAIVSPLFSFIFWSGFSQSAFYYQFPNSPYQGKGSMFFLRLLRPADFVVFSTCWAAFSREWKWSSHTLRQLRSTTISCQQISAMHRLFTPLRCSARTKDDFCWEASRWDSL